MNEQSLVDQLVSNPGSIGTATVALILLVYMLRYWFPKRTQEYQDNLTGQRDSFLKELEEQRKASERERTDFMQALKDERAAFMEALDKQHQKAVEIAQLVQDIKQQGGNSAAS